MGTVAVRKQASPFAFSVGSGLVPKTMMVLSSASLQVTPSAELPSGWTLNPAPAVVTVTHHLEELPVTTTHALLLSGGRVVACGAAPTVLADEPLSACFGVPVTVARAGGRWSARATPRW